MIHKIEDSDDVGNLTLELEEEDPRLAAFSHDELRKEAGRRRRNAIIIHNREQVKILYAKLVNLLKEEVQENGTKS